MTLLKSIVVCLVLANAGYFMWARGIARPVEMPAPMKPAATLKLASESAEALRAASTDAADAGSSGIAGSGAGADAPQAEASGPPLQGCSPM